MNFVGTKSSYLLYCSDETIFLLLFGRLIDWKENDITSKYLILKALAG